MRLILILIFLVLFQSTLLAEVKYVGSSTIGRNIIPDAARVFTEKTDIRFKDIKIPGSGKGINALIEGETPLAGISRSPKKEEKKLDLKFYVIGYDGIFVIVNPANPVNNLTINQLRDIFSGKIKNWEDVGGRNEPILPVTEKLSGKRATQVVFTKIVMGTNELIGTYGKNIMEVDEPVDEVNVVASKSNAIAAVSFAFVNKKVKPIMVNSVKPVKQNILDGLYFIARPLVLVTKKDSDPDIQKFINFMYSDEGQKIVNKYFIGVK